MATTQMPGSTRNTALTPDDMNELIERHIAAEIAGDSEAAVAMYTPDVVHDDVGAPHGPLRGPEAAKGFYDFLSANFRTEQMDVNHAWYGEDFCVIEHQCTGTALGEMLGIPGNGKRINFRMLHVWEFKDGGICRENVWLDSAAIIGQLTS
ncbi:MAG TPA: nuclear transport factor 2 family protein [Mycobacteriales bacterium]|nr:nuclear transport factor 2 family protein [Mycobacteriales bacterium]